MRSPFEGKHVEDTWSLHALALFGSTISLAAIATLLGIYDGTPVFKWHGVTLNAAIAVLAVILKGLLAFAVSEAIGQSKWIWFSRHERPLQDQALIDNASRGPLGSLQILYNPVARSFIGLGAIVVILSVAIDPFLQLAVRTTDTIVYKNDSSTQIAYANKYDQGYFTPLFTELVESTDGNTYFKTRADADFAMKSAMLYGVSQPDYRVTQQTNRSCPSANCTWTPYQSLAVCSACNDLTDRLERGFSDKGAPLDIFLDPTSSGAYALENTKPNTEYRLPNGLVLDNMEDQKSTTYMTGYGTSNSSESLSFSSKDTFLWSMTMIKLLRMDAFSDWPVSTVAGECALWYCVNEYKSAVASGNLEETFAPVPATRSPESWQVRPLSDQPHFTVQQEIKTPPEDTLNYYEDSPSLLRTDLQLGTGFNISQAAIYGIAKAMNETFLVSPPINDTSGRTRFINSYVLARGGVLTYHPTVMQILYDDSDIEATFAALAKSMTNTIRANADRSPVATGQAGTYRVLFKIHWPYLILPAILVLAGAVFLLIVIYQTRAARIAVWCSSVLPNLALGARLGTIFDGDMPLSRMNRLANSQSLQYPQSSEASKPITTGNVNRDRDYEMLSVNVAPERRSRLERSVSDVSDDGLRMGEERHSQAHLV
ncbi:MAG: hypothetical protein Q9172_006372 [Xanthocarpia lactea]